MRGIVIRFNILSGWRGLSIATLLLIAADVNARFFWQLVYLRIFRGGTSIRTRAFFSFSRWLATNFRNIFHISLRISCAIVERDTVNIDRDVLRNIVCSHYHLQATVVLLEAGARSRLLTDEILTSPSV